MFQPLTQEIRSMTGLAHWWIVLGIQLRNCFQCNPLPYYCFPEIFSLLNDATADNTGSIFSTRLVAARNQM